MGSYSVQSAASGRYLRFSNADGKVWIVPLKGMRTALNLYQPSSRNGLLVKLLLPYLYWLLIVRRVVGAQRVDVALEPEFERRLQSVLNRKEFDFSIFEGTPSVHQKVTIQLSTGAKILGYCKVSNNPDVVQLFDGEAKILSDLQSRGIENIPRVLYCGAISKGNADSIFVQSTIKTNSSEVVHRWRAEHSEFLGQLQQRTAHKILFAESDFASSLRLLDGYLDRFEVGSRATLARALERVRDHFGSGEVSFSAYHADFTPWNILFERGKIFVFDFEYASMSYPPQLDWYHFFTQTAIFERHLTAEAIVAEFRERQSGRSEMLFSAYLLDIISRYAAREGGEIGKATETQIKFWIEILGMLNI
ncbi:MAG: phosphotransferase [Rikenellaceae bacterium]